MINSIHTEQIKLTLQSIFEGATVTTETIKGQTPQGCAETIKVTVKEIEGDNLSDLNELYHNVPYEVKINRSGEKLTITFFEPEEKTE